MSYDEVLLCIFGMFVASYIARFLPFAVLGNRDLPAAFRLWLQYVPTAVFGALVFTSIFGGATDGFRFSLDNKEMLASIAVLPVAAKTKSLPYSIITGLVVYWLAQQFI